ncbi:2Fe-2S iron-sulfur cluster-binding protein [Phytohabitans flavus]|uniref:2Fe-2S iron-sulfur cluster-binding protein n=1 Tax=Phytohabitans flavus TaxID=1076124 RepID=UPI0018D9889B|nr:2Fe-2S iron-sulfur cluster-binding protein [Phytohabitans flavus]
MNFRHRDGSIDVVDAPLGSSLMSAAIKHPVDGIIAECGGNAMCATCHVYVDAAFGDRLPPMAEEEDEMLDGTASARTERSRLSCQIVVTEEMAGMTVDVPADQV